ncbi:MAG: uncharacterized protein PWP37_1315 [Thermotogota bacterium]|nr:uncharacterized protein [Thermotogota bacterium]MDK2865123.1 uncharacterized protein [Thermotogota bacterium]HCZ07097.1 DUF503 domain-containing protein [Thermotogota bacterium]
MWGVSMALGYGTLQLRLFGISSLKEKRSITKSLLNDIRKRFNVSVIESGSNDSKLILEISYAIVARTRAEVDSISDSLVRFIEDFKGYQIVSERRESW